MCGADAVVDAMLATVDDALEDVGDRDLVHDLVARVRRDGTGAERQRAAVRRGGRGALRELYRDTLVGRGVRSVGLERPPAATRSTRGAPPDRS
jgi:carboxylate-amine ligase